MTILDVARLLKVSTAVFRVRWMMVMVYVSLSYKLTQIWAGQLRRQKAVAIGFIIPTETERFDESYFMEFIAGFDGVDDSLQTIPPLTMLDIPAPDIARQLGSMFPLIIQRKR